jgi:Uma2 family endonuclease
MQQVRRPKAAEPEPRRWSKAEYYRMAELGWFQGQRVELLEGEIVVLSPQNRLHAATTDKVAEVLRKVLGPGFWVRMQLPLDLGASTEPEPDVSVVAGARGDYRDHPTTALLVVEVSDTTLRHDRVRKSGLYARAKIADYWMVNLTHRQLEVRRSPVPYAGHRTRARYTSRSVLTAADSISPLVAPHVSIAVLDLLP